MKRFAQITSLGAQYRLIVIEVTRSDQRVVEISLRPNREKALAQARFRGCERADEMAMLNTTQLKGGPDETGD